MKVGPTYRELIDLALNALLEPRYSRWRQECVWPAAAICRQLHVTTHLPAPWSILKPRSHENSWRQDELGTAAHSPLSHCTTAHSGVRKSVRAEISKCSEPRILDPAIVWLIVRTLGSSLGGRDGNREDIQGIPFGLSLWSFMPRIILTSGQYSMMWSTWLWSSQIWVMLAHQNFW
jgi:hypothetical protein